MTDIQNDHEHKFKGITWYARRGWPIFPCGADKTPLTHSGFKDATLDIKQLRAWHDQHPGANWGMPTGPTTELVVIDIDAKTPKHSADGFVTWDQLREEHSDPIQTVTVRTGGGGSQLYFKYPKGAVIKSRANVLGAGIDIRGMGGYVIVPGISKTDKPYTFEFSPADTEIQELPAWISEKVSDAPSTQNQADPQPAKDDPQEYKDFVAAAEALHELSPDRAEQYDSWLHVGMALFDLGDAGLVLWDQWSKQAGDKYKAGDCAKKWKTFNKNLTGANQITLASLFHWAQEDGNQNYVKEGRKGANITEYSQALEAMGFNFSLNDMNDLIYINGRLRTDILTDVISYKMRAKNYRNDQDTQKSMVMAAHNKKFHPIKDYLNDLILDGSQDHIGRLASFFQDRDGTFKTILTKWLVGAVGRILDEKKTDAGIGPFHPMMVLDGPQGIGKSRFAWWIGSALPEFFIQSSVNTDDKDFMISLCSKWIWEVEELGAALRRNDRESFKAFLGKEKVTVRKPYGHDSITKPVTVSFIGTINNSGGFLSDPTGNRRYRVCTITGIDWAYESAIDINQIWAQARELYTAGERWTLPADEEKRMTENNTLYEVDEAIHYHIFEAFNITPQDTTKWAATAMIIDKLRADGKIVGGNNALITQQIADLFTKMGCVRQQKTVNGNRVRGWVGVWPR